MNDSKDNAKPLPPDDFAATTPNIKMPKQNLPNNQNDSVNDWEKTNYNYSAKDMPQDDKWKKTAYNVPAPQNPPPKNDEWGMTQANVNLPNQPNQYDQPPRDNYGSKQAEYGATTPFINLPQNERAKYDVPPSSASVAPAAVSIPNIKVEEEKKQEVKKGIPSWLWAGGGMLVMFFFAIAVLLGVYFLFLGKKGYDVALKQISKDSQVFVNGSSWGVTNADGTIRLQGLRAKESKLIHVIDPTASSCKDETVTGEDGDPIKDVVISCDHKATGNTGDTTKPSDIPDDCKSIKSGDFPKSRKCANDALDKIGDNPFTVQQLLDAMNLYIVNFDKNKFNIKPEDEPFLKRAAGYILRLEKASPNVNIQVGGHTDTDGTDAKNEPLSKNRANAVRDKLVSFGVNAAMLETQGYGSKVPKPGNQNRNDDEKFQNRRIEYKAILK